MRATSPFRKALCVATLAACALLLQGCSTVKLAYNQVPHLAYWQLNRYLGLSDMQTERVREELGELHQWHRDTMLPRHAELLQAVTIAVVGEVPLARLWHAVPAYPTISELWLRWLEAYGRPR